MLKGRWLVLHKGISAEAEFVPYVIECCVRLHTFLIEEGDGWERLVDARDEGTDVTALDGEQHEEAVQMRDDFRGRIVGRVWTLDCRWNSTFIMRTWVVIYNMSLSVPFSC